MLTDAQIEQRLYYLTGSDAGVVCGENKFSSIVELWMYKTRRAVPKDISDKPSVIAGNRLEQAVADWFTAVTGKQLIKDETFYVHPIIPFLGGNIDRFVVDEDAIFEAKTTQSDEGWGAGYEAGENQIPGVYLCQVIHYLAVTGHSVAYIAVLIRGIDFRWYRYERNLQLEDAVISREVEFWSNHVVKDVAPDPKTESDVLSLLQGHVTNEPAIADFTIDVMLDNLHIIKQQIKSLETTGKEFRDSICVYMNEKQTLVGVNGRIRATWKAREGSKRFNIFAFRKDYPELAKDYEVQGDTVRTFLIKE